MMLPSRRFQHFSAAFQLELGINHCIVERMHLRRSTAKISSGILCLAGLLGEVATSNAATISIDFEGFPDSTILTNQYSGVTFSNAIILTAGISLNEFEFPPHSGVNVASDNGGPITIDFSTPITSFSGYFTYLESITIDAFDAGNSQVASATSLFSNNLACLAGPPCSGDPGSSPNEFIQVAFTGGISSITITGDPAGGSFTMDDATYTSTVPEPAQFLSVSICVLALIASRRRIGT
jgi:hypothetical protein